MSRMYSPQASQDGRAGKARVTTSTSSSTKREVLSEFDRLLMESSRRVPGAGDSGDRSDVSGEEQQQMAIMEKDLREDAPWKRIQQKTFTRWINEHLKTAGESIGDLETDLSDGLQLIRLLELLTRKRFPRFNKAPAFRSQKLENVSLALAFLDEEGVKIVSIDSTDIVDGRLKLILALIWALILKYSISSLKLCDEEEEGDSAWEKMTPKEKLLSWFSSKLPLPVKNFTTDWNDGRACGALDNAVAPGLCPDWESWDPKDALRNATEAMNLAEKWLGVPQLISPEDMIDPNMDEQSMMTYLAQFPIAQPKPGAPFYAKSSGDARAVRCTGRGLQSTGIRIGDEVFFQVCTKTAGEGALTATVIGPDAQQVPLENTGKVSTAVHEFSYAPEKPGLHYVHVLFGGRHVPKSPFEVKVGMPWNSKIEASGPGLAGGVVGSAAEFSVDAKGEAGMLGPSQVTIECKDRGDLKASVKYWPTLPGEYAVHILCGEEDIPGSPFMADIVERPDAVDSPVAAVVRITQQESSSPLKTESVDSSETTEVTEDGTTIVTRRETRMTSQVMTSSSSHHVVQTFTEELGEAGLGLGGLDMLSLGASASGGAQDIRSLGGTRCDVTKVVASGSGLERAACNKTNTFVVKADSAAGYNMLMVGIYGKILHAHEVQVQHLGHAHYQVNYKLKERGEYLLSVKYGDVHIPGSPFVINCV
ncbi:Filamin-B [Hypsibius exemplaris]|uniref:Filamin-B n=1 Tax=Hypsibius exemplaris TaxID=2072580 RepID=A0A1W0WD20_HYPEX|nr:Filamin-B [Hypsibius exemplaris]